MTTVPLAAVNVPTPNLDVTPVLEASAYLAAMTLPLVLCTLIALTSGLHFGREFAAEHRNKGNMLIPVMAHIALSAVLMVVSVLLDQSETSLLWMIVATGSMGGLAIGALMPAPQRKPAKESIETPSAALHA